MGRQNRVTPTGELVAVAARGTLMGNRGGCLHDDEGRIVRRQRSRAWICCVLEFKGRRRTVMTPRRYTELFFLDEATALAAGHRPCFECRRADALSFAALAAAAGPARAAALDDALHPHRWPTGARHPTWRAAARDLPDGAVVLVAGEAFLLAGSRQWRWTPAGYRAPGPPASGNVDVLTPPPAVRALAHGYRPRLHPTATAAG